MLIAAAIVSEATYPLRNHGHNPQESGSCDAWEAQKPSMQLVTTEGRRQRSEDRQNAYEYVNLTRG